MESGDQAVRIRAMSLTCAACVVATGAPAVVPQSASAKFGDHPLRKGSHGRDVRVLQRWLTMLGVPTPVDGAYGRGTARSVRLYERRNRMHVDGRVSTLQARGLRQRVFSLPLAAGQAVGPGATARIGPDGLHAIVPAASPPQVQAAIAAANRIVGTPYKWGGGHGRWEDRGYDCSGAVSYALHGAGLLNSPLDSTGFKTYGAAGAGQWITIYANKTHAYTVIAGLRFDTSGTGGKGPRWRADSRSGSGFKTRHPAGL